MASKSQITDAIETLSKVYGKEPGDLRGFFWALGDANYDTLLEASQAWVRGNKWMPSPSELRDLCAGIEYERAKADEPRQIRQRAYQAFDQYREGEITLEQFQEDRAVKWAQKQHGIFSGLFSKRTS